MTGQNKAADLSSLLMIHSVATAFKSLLRPSDLISHDKGPAESLAAVITDVITDVDKVLKLNLNIPVLDQLNFHKSNFFFILFYYFTFAIQCIE